MGSIEDALEAAGAGDDLQTILHMLEDKSVGFKRQEAAAEPFANVDTTGLVGLNVRMRTVMKSAQQQQKHPGGLSVPIRPHIVVFSFHRKVTLHPAFEQSYCRLSVSSVA